MRLLSVFRILAYSLLMLSLGSTGSAYVAFADVLPQPSSPQSPQRLHPQKIVVAGVEGVWFPKDEAVSILNVVEQAEKLKELALLQAQASILSRHAVISATTAASLSRQALDGSTVLLNQCHAALDAETQRCESVWRQPFLPMLGGLALGVATCIGVAHALPHVTGAAP